MGLIIFFLVIAAIASLMIYYDPFIDVLADCEVVMWYNRRQDGQVKRKFVYLYKRK